MPKNPDDYQRYKSYYLAREASPEGVKKRAERQRARRHAVADGRLAGKRDPREVDHKTPLSKGGSGKDSNTRVTGATANRKKFDH